MITSVAPSLAPPHHPLMASSALHTGCSAMRRKTPRNRCRRVSRRLRQQPLLHRRRHRRRHRRHRHRRPRVSCRHASCRHASCRRVSRRLPHTGKVRFGNHTLVWGEGVRRQPLPRCRRPCRHPPDQVRWSEMSRLHRHHRRRRPYLRGAGRGPSRRVSCRLPPCRRRLPPCRRRRHRLRQ